jgi:hypothetical protein
MTIDMRHILLVINSYLNFKTYSITFINCRDKVIQWKLDKVLKSWKRSKMSWIGIAWGNMEDGHMGLKHSSQNFTHFNGDMFWGLGLFGIKTRVGSPVETWHVSVGGRCWGSCFKVHGFQPSKIGARPPLKHDIFPCRFVPRPTLLVHGKLCWATLKQAMHFWLVVEIASRGNPI